MNPASGWQGLEALIHGAVVAAFTGIQNPFPGIPHWLMASILVLVLHFGSAIFKFLRQRRRRNAIASA
jgi:hypothetical protein